MITEQELTELERLHAAAEAAPWEVWDGPQYCGGGHDLCIGSGEKWLANMDHYQGLDHAERQAHDSALGDEGRHPTDCRICSFNDEVDAKQKASADLICAARNSMPALLSTIREQAAEIERLRQQNREHENLMQEAQTLYPEGCEPSPYTTALVAHLRKEIYEMERRIVLGHK